MKKLTVFMLFFIITCLSCQAENAFFLTKEGMPNATIILPKDATQSEKYATDELIKYVKAISGAELPVAETPRKGNNIYIGQTKPAKDLLKGMDWNSLRDDSIFIRCNGSDRLVLSGGTGSGTIYAVYTFLEENFGVKYILPDEDYIPENKTLKVKKYEQKFTSPFIARESFFKNNQGGNWQYNLKLKQNGQNNPVPKEYGGHVVLVGFAHTFETMMSQDKYAEKHPEWYSFRNGKRLVTGHYQLCLTNEEMIKELTKNVLEIIENNPDEKIFSVTQCDNSNYCECDECKALTEKYGHSGALLTVVNRVADAVKEKYPDKIIETFAYHYTQPAPKGNIKPRDNVIIRLCSIEADFSKPYDNPSNKAFMDSLTQWSSISKMLYIWDYSADFVNFIIPFPDTQVLQKDMQIIAKNKAIAILHEGDYKNSNAWLLAYRSYIIAKLTWNPDIDMEKESKDFFKAYYGPAWEDMYAYMKDFEAYMLKCDFYLRENEPGMNYMTADQWIKGFKYLNSALKKSEGNQKYYDRVYLDMLCQSAGAIFTKKKVYNQVKEAGVMPVSDRKTFSKKLIEYAKKFGISHFSEGKTMEQGGYTETSFEKTGVKPDMCKDLADDQWADFQAPVLNNSQNNEKVSKLVDDAKALNGKARWVNSAINDWFTQIQLVSLFSTEKYNYADMYITYRVAPGKKEGKAYTVGVYGITDGWIINEQINSTDTPDGNYRTKKLGTLNLNDLALDIYMWVAGAGDGDVSEGLYIDRIFFIYR